ncbi:hypothetical protein AK812_SmicGene10591 [Symbiodinium microadriaticum]|uniref:Uncharacterized protein n=1 Tax=Symbiodinium microadriaticum TaxID=2951 RepID=A0A1Q9EFC8_SYMMI|nr:hypothetical protein AK812_SmicGene10591 [Symbiodinium microadriaticum]
MLAQELPITAALDLQDRSTEPRWWKSRRKEEEYRKEEEEGGEELKQLLPSLSSLDLMLGPGDTLMVTAPVSFDFAVPVPARASKALVRTLHSLLGSCIWAPSLAHAVQALVCAHMGDGPQRTSVRVRLWSGGQLRSTGAELVALPQLDTETRQEVMTGSSPPALSTNCASEGQKLNSQPCKLFLFTADSRIRRAPLQTAVAPRFSVGDIQIIFRPRQSAQALSLDSRPWHPVNSCMHLLIVQLQEDPGLGIDLSSADLEVTDGPQLIKEVLLLRPAVSRLALAADFAAGRLFGLRLRNVKNPEARCQSAVSPGMTAMFFFDMEPCGKHVLNTLVDEIVFKQAQSDFTVQGARKRSLDAQVILTTEAAAGAAVAAAAGGQACVPTAERLDWTTQGRDEIAVGSKHLRCFACLPRVAWGDVRSEELEVFTGESHILAVSLNLFRKDGSKGLLQILPNSPFLESSFFDFPDTEADVGQRFLIFAPAPECSIPWLENTIPLAMCATATLRCSGSGRSFRCSARSPLCGVAPRPRRFAWCTALRLLRRLLSAGSLRVASLQEVERCLADAIRVLRQQAKARSCWRPLCASKRSSGVCGTRLSRKLHPMHL